MKLGKKQISLRENRSYNYGGRINLQKESLEVTMKCQSRGKRVFQMLKNHICLGSSISAIVTLLGNRGCQGGKITGKKW